MLVFLCVCPLIDDDFRHNIVKIAVDPLGEASRASNQFLYDRYDRCDCYNHMETLPERSITAITI